MWLTVKIGAFFSGSNACPLPFPSFCFCLSYFCPLLLLPPTQLQYRYIKVLQDLCVSGLTLGLRLTWTRTHWTLHFSKGLDLLSILASPGSPPNPCKQTVWPHVFYWIWAGCNWNRWMTGHAFWIFKSRIRFELDDDWSAWSMQMELMNDQSRFSIGDMMKGNRRMTNHVCATGREDLQDGSTRRRQSFGRICRSFLVMSY